MSGSESSRFPTTQWTGVQRAGQQNTFGRLALGELLTRYAAPLRAHLIFGRRLPRDSADDLLQAFICDRVLEQELVECAAQEKGKFRTFLLVALNRFVSNSLRDSKRQCRSPRQGACVEDAANAVDPQPGPCEAFELAWARQVLVRLGHISRN